MTISLIDPAAIPRFWDLGIRVYSDEPFPAPGRARPQCADADLQQAGRHPACLATPFSGSAARHGRRTSRPRL